MVWSAPYTMNPPEVSDGSSESRVTRSLCHCLLLPVQIVTRFLQLLPVDFKSAPLRPLKSSLLPLPQDCPRCFWGNPLEFLAIPSAQISFVLLGLESPLRSWPFYSYLGLLMSTCNINTWNDPRTSPQIINLQSPWQLQGKQSNEQTFQNS